MTKLHYVGFNGYHQCPKNENNLPKVITDWTCSEQGVQKVTCIHRLLIVETEELFKIYGFLRDDSLDCLHVVQKPEKIVEFASSEDFLIASAKRAIWKYSFKLLEWMKLIFSFTNRKEECYWDDSENRILKISLQQNVSDILLLLSNGSVWTLSKTDKLTLIYPFDVDKAVDITSGFEHSLILTESGCVLSLGNGSRGQLGDGDLNSTPQPVQIAAFEGLVITKIAAGGWHSCAITDSGDLCTWGWNNYGQLSAFESGKEIGMSALPVFVDVENESELKVVDVACGSRHTVALLENGDLFSAGWNAYSQLGLGVSSEKFSRFTKCTLQNTLMGKLFCGPWYTIFLEESAK